MHLTPLLACEIAVGTGAAIAWILILREGAKDLLRQRSVRKDATLNIMEAREQ